METEGLFKEDFVFDGPVVGVRREIGQVRHRPFHVVFVPEQHTQRLFYKRMIGRVKRERGGVERGVEEGADQVKEQP